MSGIARAYCLALDPGSKPGVAALSIEGIVLAVTHNLTHALAWSPEGCDAWPLLVCESQWHFVRPNSPSVNNLLTLAYRAGAQQMVFPAVRRLRLKPQVWRGSANVDKAQLQRRCAKELTAQERVLFSSIPASRHGDVLDAVMIGRAGLCIAPTTTKYDWVL